MSIFRRGKRSPRFEDYAQEFLAWSKVNHRHNTFGLHYANIKVLLEHFSGRRLSGITPAMVEAFKARRSGCRRRGNGWRTPPSLRQPVSPVSVNRALTTLRLLFNRAIRSGEFRGLLNPVSAVSRFPEFGSMRIVTREEEYRYFAAIKSGDLWDMARLMLETGMRPHEVLGLRLMDVDLRFKVVSVANHVRRTAPVVLGKTESSIRTVPLSNEAIAAVERRLQRMDGDPLAFLFPGRDPRHHRKSIRKAHDLAIQRAGIMPAFHLYDLRHTFATREAQAGVPLPILAALLGHSSIEMTMRYVHPQEEAKRAAIHKLELVNLAS